MAFKAEARQRQPNLFLATTHWIVFVRKSRSLCTSLRTHGTKRDDQFTPVHLYGINGAAIKFCFEPLSSLFISVEKPLPLSEVRRFDEIFQCNVPDACTWATLRS